jgi:transposase
MKSRAELRREFAGAPVELLEYAGRLQQEVAQARAQLTQQAQALIEQQQLLAEARTYIAELKRQLFGLKADHLNPEQEEQLRPVAGDQQEHHPRPPPVSRDVLEPDLPLPDQEKRQRELRQRRPPLPAVQLEMQRVLLEPAHKICGRCQAPGRKIGEEVTPEYEYVAAKLVCKETVRPKYAHACACAAEAVSIAPLPPRLVPQSRLGLGLAVYLLLSRFDDHLAYYTLERIFRERHGVSIPRQQMVQWVEKIAFLLLAIYHGIWEELQATGYLQVDETPVKVLDPEVKGKAATGYLWFYSPPRAMSSWSSARAGAGKGRRNAWLTSKARCKPMPMPSTICCGGSGPPCSGGWGAWLIFGGGGLSARRSISDRQQSRGKRGAALGGRAQALALHRPSRRGLAQCGHLYHHSKLPPPRPQPTGIFDRCAGPPARHEKPRGQGPAAQSLAAQGLRRRFTSYPAARLTLTIMQAVCLPVGVL